MGHYVVFIPLSTYLLLYHRNLDVSRNCRQGLWYLPVKHLLPTKSELGECLVRGERDVFAVNAKALLIGNASLSNIPERAMLFWTRKLQRLVVFCE
jgi:hypothetical protein